jgi:hypothetical protein
MSVASTRSVAEMQDALLNLESKLLCIIETVKIMEKRIKYLESLATQHGIQIDSAKPDEENDSCIIC